MCLDAGIQAHGIVEAGLDGAGAMGRCAIVFGDLHGHGLNATGIVRAHGRHEDSELVLVGRRNADDLACCHHERTNVERSARAERRHPRLVGLDDHLNGLDELVLREGWHHDAASGVCHTGGVEVRAEADDVAVFGGIGLETLEDLLAVMEDARALGECERVIGGEAALLPSAVLVVADVAVVRGLIGEAEATPVDILLLCCHGCSPRIDTLNRAQTQSAIACPLWYSVHTRHREVSCL